MYDHKKLTVYQKSMDLAERVYQITRLFPRDELYGGLISQIRKSVVSIPSNLAEGYGRQQLGDRRRFVEIALGSVCELETQLRLADRFKYLDAAPEAVPVDLAKPSIHDDTQEVHRMLYGLWKSLQAETS